MCRGRRSWHAACTPRVECCERLRREHDLICGVLAAVESALGRTGDGIRMPAALLAAALEFFDAFVVRCHEAKEEQAFFPLLERRGVPQETLAALRRQHAEGQRIHTLLRARSLMRHGHAEAAHLFRQYVRLERTHLALEGGTLFALAETVLSREDDETMQAAFDGIERAVGGMDGREVLLSLGRALTDACRSVGDTMERRATLARDLVRRPAIATPDDTLARAKALMDSLGTREVAVVQHGTLIGLVTRSDLEPHRGHLEWTTVRAAMTPNPITVAPEAPASSVAHLLVERGFNAVPVTAGGNLLGMISRSDLLSLLEDPGAAPAPGLDVTTVGGS